MSALTLESAYVRGTEQMGEVRVKVKLINAVDEALARRGQMASGQIRTYETNALVDTGAVSCALPIQVVQRLGIETIGKRRARFANDLAEDVDVTEAVGIEIDGRRATEETLVVGSGVLIGQTILERLDLLVDCMNHRVVPNPANPDQPIINMK